MDLEFNVPYYIFEEIVEYVEQTAQGRCRCMKWENIKSLLKLAFITNKITEEQYIFLQEKYNRENH